MNSKYTYLAEYLSQAIEDCRSRTLDSVEQEVAQSERWPILRSKILKFFGERGLTGRVQEILADLEAETKQTTDNE